MRAVLLAWLLIAVASPVAAQETPARARVVARTIETVIRPGYQRLADATRTAAGRAKAVCENPSDNGLSDMRADFSGLVSAFSFIEPIRFGPITDDNRIERILFWPDRRGVALRQAQEILARRDETALDPVSLHAKSVAVQGLTALEFVLFGSGAEAIGTSDGAFRCRYGQAILAHLDEMSQSVAREWGPDSAIVRRMTKPDPADPRYRTVNDALEEIFSTAAHGLEALRDVKLVPGIGKAGEEAKPTLFLFRRSGLTATALAGNANGLSALLSEGGLFELLPEASRWVGPSIELEFETIERVLERLKAPVAETVQDPDGRQALESVVLAVRGVEESLSTEVAPALGLSTGFSSLDGD